MVLSYTNLSEYYSESAFNTNAFNSLNDISLLGQTPPKLTLDSRFSRPTFLIDRYVSDSESDDEDMFESSEMSLFDLPAELFVNCILPQMDIRDLKQLRATCHYAKSLVDMSQDWDARYESDFGDMAPLPGSGFLRYIRRANASCMISGVVAKGSKLQHIALDSRVDQDILQMRTAHHNNKTWMAPFMPMRQMQQPARTIETTDLILGSDGKIRQIGATDEQLLSSVLNTRIVQLDASLARNADGELFRIKFDDQSDERELTLAPLGLKVDQFNTIKNRIYALLPGVGLISWLSTDEDEQNGIDYTVLLASDLVFESFDVFEHNYGTLCDVALSTNQGVYTFQFDKASSKAGMRNEISDCTYNEIKASKVVYYEEGVFLALCPEDYVYRLKGKTTTPVASLRNISDLVVSKQGFCLALDHSGKVYSWDLRTRREVSTWAIGSIVKGVRVPIANPQVAKVDGHVVSISCDDKFAFALVA